MQMEEIFEHIDKNFDFSLEEFRSFIRQPSISAENIGIKETCDFLLKCLSNIGINADLYSIEKGNPLILGKLEFEGNTRTLLVYSHYDVQPVDPEKWTVTPFGAEMIDGKIYGRGTCDCKGNVFAFIKSLEAFLKTTGRTPVNIKFIIDGEEEIGDPNLPEVIKRNRERLRADATLFVDTHQDFDDRVMVGLGFKGLLYIEIRAKGPKTDLHSMHSAYVSSPTWKLINALNTMKMDDMVLIDGFYEDIGRISPEEEDVLSRIDFDEEDFRKRTGIEKFIEAAEGKQLLRKMYFGPTCNICGLKSGYLGDGIKTLLPSEASVKIDFRLVGNQDPNKIFDEVKKHLREKGFSDLEILKIAAEEPSRISPTESLVTSTARAIKQVFDKEAVICWSAGTAPAALFNKILAAPMVYTGVGYLYLAHGPDEYITVDQFRYGIKLIATIIHEFSKT